MDLGAWLRGLGLERYEAKQARISTGPVRSSPAWREVGANAYAERGLDGVFGAPKSSRAIWPNDRVSELSPGTGWSTSDIKAVAREAEAAGFEAIFGAEVNNDVLATAQLMGGATTRIKVGSWVTNIYLRHSYLCAQGPALISDATGGCMILGLGVSHQSANRALGIDIPPPTRALRQYVTEVAGWLRAEGPPTHLPW